MKSLTSETSQRVEISSTLRQYASFVQRCALLTHVLLKNALKNSPCLSVIPIFLNLGCFQLVRWLTRVCQCHGVLVGLQEIGTLR